MLNHDFYFITVFCIPEMDLLLTLPIGMTSMVFVCSAVDPKFRSAGDHQRRATGWSARDGVNFHGDGIIWL